MSIEKKLISVIMPVYNSEKYLQESIESILGQSYSNFELLLINDASTDSSLAIMQDYAARDKRITILNNEFAKGVSGGLNTGLKHAKAHLIARIDADDICLPNRFAIQLEYLEAHPEIFLLGTAFERFRDNKTIDTIRYTKNPIIIGLKVIHESSFCHPSVMYRKEIFTKTGNYPKVPAEDFHLFSDVTKYFRTTNLGTVLLRYRIHEKNTTSLELPEIIKGIKEKFIMNYHYYVGAETKYGAMAEMYYDFCHHQKLSWKKSLIVMKIGLSIINKIRADYGYSLLSVTFIESLFAVKFQVLQILITSILRVVKK